MDVLISTTVGADRCFARVEIASITPGESSIVADGVSKLAPGDVWHAGVGEELAVARALRDASRELMRRAYAHERKHPEGQWISLNSQVQRPLEIRY